MKIILTGMTGTLAPYVQKALLQKGYEVVSWNRADLSTEDQEAINQFIEKEKPDYFFHLATGPQSWIEKIILALKPTQIPFLFTSTESVFDNTQEGPFTTDIEPKSTSDYGSYKISCENLIKEQYPEHSYIVRLGWQIGLLPEKNNMLTYLVKEDILHASDEWIPSTSFMPDTANGLIQIIESLQPGTYHLDGNEDNWSFYQIASALKEAFNLPIEVLKDNNFNHNNRLLNDPILTQSIQKTIEQIRSRIQ
ncbi:MAG: NAD-dependent epimerase/dehydratase [Clostridiales bacterium]|jgi:dTDP-4-dehydrorhamnose reductase|nr:NAD-dependent epimerase/dehydratase [Clostridiales bacterium]